MALACLCCPDVTDKPRLSDFAARQMYVIFILYREDNAPNALDSCSCIITQPCSLISLANVQTNTHYSECKEITSLCLNQEPLHSLENNQAKFTQHQSYPFNHPQNMTMANRFQDTSNFDPNETFLWGNCEEEHVLLNEKEQWTQALL